MQTSATPVTKALFLALHPPRRCWPGLTGFYVSPSQAKAPARRAKTAS